MLLCFCLSKKYIEISLWHTYILAAAWCKTITRLLLFPGHQNLTHWTLGDVSAIINVQFSNCFFSKSHPVKFLLGERRKPNDDKSTVVQVMAWCHQAASHYLSQCWSRSVSPYGDTKPSELSKGLSTDDDEFFEFSKLQSSKLLKFYFSSSHKVAFILLGISKHQCLSVCRKPGFQSIVLRTQGSNQLRAKPNFLAIWVASCYQRTVIHRISGHFLCVFFPKI